MCQLSVHIFSESTDHYILLKRYIILWKKKSSKFNHYWNSTLILGFLWNWRKTYLSGFISLLRMCYSRYVNTLIEFLSKISFALVSQKHNSRLLGNIEKLLTTKYEPFKSIFLSFFHLKPWKHLRKIENEFLPYF